MWQHQNMPVVNATRTKLRYRRSGASWLGAITVLVFATPFAAGVFLELNGISRLVLAPVAVIAVAIPLLIAVWSLRSGVDVTDAGITIKALFANRHVPWSAVDSLDASGSAVLVVTDDGTVLPLPNVRAADVQQLIDAGGVELVSDSQ